MVARARSGMLQRASFDTLQIIAHHLLISLINSMIFQTIQTFYPQRHEDHVLSVQLAQRTETDGSKHRSSSFPRLAARLINEDSSTCFFVVQTAVDS
jgi:hypothetical protein